MSPPLFAGRRNLLASGPYHENRMRALRARFPAICILTTSLLLAGPAARGQAPPGPPPPPAPPAGPFTVPRTPTPIKVDGALDDAGWASALRMELPYEVQPAENVPAPVRTECWLTYDDRYLYVGFRAYDPEPSRIRAHISDRDPVFRDDSVGVFLDTFGDDRRAFQFHANPAGVQADGVKNDVGSGDDDFGGEGHENLAWDAIWDSAGRITREGYEVEMAIPFTSLRFPPPERGRPWGFLATRNYPRTVRHQLSLIPIDRNRNCTVCQNVKIVGFEGIVPGRNVELDPTLTLHRTDERPEFPSGAMERGKVEADPGLSARWGITPGLSLNAALNPDFYQVEADAQQLAVNTRFALYYPEKRPLFLEGADYFETPFRTVHTRTLADPSWGIKLSGKQGRSALGVFVGHDTETNLVLPANQESENVSLGSGSDAAILRYRVDLGKSSALGALVTAREGEEYHNRVAGVDGIFRLSHTEKITFQSLRSSTAYPWGEDLDGSATTLAYQHESRGWNGWVAYNDLGRDFRADLGFIPRVDTREGEVGYEKIWWGKPGAAINLVRVGGMAARIEDHDGRLTDQAVEATFYAQGPFQSWLEAEVAREKEYFQGTTFDEWTGHWFFNIRPTGDFTCSLGGRLGDQVDYSRLPDRPREGRAVRFVPGVTYDRRHVRLQLDHTFEALDVTGGRLYRANLTQLKLAYHLSVRTFFRAILQYEAIRSDPVLYEGSTFIPSAQSRSLASQLLYSYKLNPQTVLFVGYSEGRVGETGLALTQSDRTLFVKLGYAWVL